MIVREVTPYVMASPGRDYVFVKVTTDEGIYGWGEGTLEMKQQTVATAVRDLSGFVIGADPTRIDYLWNRMYRHGFWRGGEAVLSAISAIEQALWDITGKAYGQPVYKLLGGPVRDYLPAYTHCGDVEVAQRLRDEEGWMAFKSGPRNSPGLGYVSETDLIATTVQAYERMRVDLGDDVELMCDVHGRLRPSATIRLARALESYRLLFYEEPIPPDNIKALKRVRAAGLSMDLATGERAFTKWGYRELIEGQLVDVIQPDLCHDGGIKETLKIAAMAETYYIQVAPHNPNGPVGTAASIQAAACIPNFLILEYANSPTRDVCQRGEPLKARNGRLELPTAPGLGIDLDEDYLQAHEATGPALWRGSFYQDGGVADV